jgi:hypothetical protein
MKLALDFFMLMSLNAFAAGKKPAAKGPAKSSKRAPASAAATPTPAQPKRSPAAYSTFRFEERVVGGKTVLCGVTDSAYGNAVSCVVVDGVGH